MLDKLQTTLTNGFRAFRGADLIINARVRFLSRLLLHACVFCQDYYCTRAFFVKAIIARVRFFASVYNNQQRNISKVLAEIRRHHPNSKWSKPVIWQTKGKGFRKSGSLGDPYGNRTHVTAVKGPCLNRLTNGPHPNRLAEIGSGDWTWTHDLPGMNRLL